MILFFLGGSFALAFFALICGLCHADTPPPVKPGARGQLVDIQT